MFRKPITLAALAFSVLAAGAAQAQQICAPRANLVEKLKAEFNEEPEAVGVTTNGGLFEVLSSSEGTWTVLATGPNGVSCLVLSGEGWQTRTEPSHQPDQGPGREGAQPLASHLPVARDLRAMGRRAGSCPN